MHMVPDDFLSYLGSGFRFKGSGFTYMTQKVVRLLYYRDQGRRNIGNNKTFESAPQRISGTPWRA